MGKSRGTTIWVLGVAMMSFSVSAEAAYRINMVASDYGGQAIQDIDVTIDSNAIRAPAYGVIGPSGAGKTSTISTMAEVAAPSQGRALTHEPETLVMDEPTSSANDLKEVIYRYDLQRIYYVDHVSQAVRWEPMAGSGQSPGGSVIAGAPEGADENQKAMLANMFQQFTKPRVDPKVEVKARRNGNTASADVGGKTLTCAEHDLMRMGGKIGTGCFVAASDLPGGTEFLDWLRTHPQWAGGFPDLKDPLWRTLVTAWKQGDVATLINLQRGDEGSREDDLQLELLSIDNFEEGDVFSVSFPSYVAPEER